jgi:hypothetical protein
MMIVVVRATDNIKTVIIVVIAAKLLVYSY